MRRNSLSSQPGLYSLSPLAGHARSARVRAVALCLLAACSGESIPGTDPPVTRGNSSAIVIAHRGASFEAPEHTTAAYDLAIEQKADYIELDVARTRDGVLVVIHDATADRTLRGPAGSCTGRIADRTLDDLTQCDAGSWFNAAFPARANPAFASLRLLTLDEVLTRYAGRTRFYIEMKDPDLYPGIEGGIAAILAQRGLRGSPASGPERVFIQSFSSASLRRMNAIAPDLPLILAITGVSPAIVRDSASSVSSFADGVAPRWESIDAAVVEDAHARCLVIHPYTVDEDREVQSLLALGVDGIFTNRPRAVRLAIESSVSPGSNVDLCA